MERYYFVILSIFVSLLLLSCAPVLRKDFMDTAIRDISMSEIKRNPEFFKGKLFVLGGIIVNTKVTAEGSLIESLYVAVDSRGYLKGVGLSTSRFLALFPRESGLLDPMIFRNGREITLAGEFIGNREGKIDEMEYVYPLFRIKELYLWEERKDYCVVPAYYYPYPYWMDYPYWWGDRPFLRYYVPPFW
jgi:outer membrane lipoprotein